MKTWLVVVLVFCGSLVFVSSESFAESSGKAASKQDRPTASSIEGGPLKNRLTVVDVDLPAKIDLGNTDYGTADWYQSSSVNRVIFSPQPNGEAKVAWMDSTGYRIHITPLDRNFKRKGKDVILNGQRIRDMLAHDDGAAALILRDGGFHLTRVSEKGEVRFDPRLIGLTSHDMHQGRIAFNGKTYGTYFGVQQNFGPIKGTHQGDALVTVAGDGETKVHWSWGCSHSIDMRLTYVNGKLIPLALTDAYPAPGMWFNHSVTQVTYENGSTNGYVSARIGGMVEFGDHMVIAYTTEKLGRWEAALAAFQKKGPYKRVTPRWLTDTPDQTEANIKIAKYGKNLLISWEDLKGGKRFFRLYDFDVVSSKGDGKELSMNARPLGEPEALPVAIGPIDDFRSLSNGDVVWAAAWGDAHKLRIIRLAAAKQHALAAAD